MGDKPSFKDRLAGAMRFVRKPRICLHCTEMEPMPTQHFCYPCESVARKLGEVEKAGLISRFQRRELWAKCKGNYLATVELGDLVTDHLLKLKEGK